MQTTSNIPAHTLQLALDERSYAIEIGPGLLTRGIPHRFLQEATAVIVVSNEVVFPLYGSALMATITATGARAFSIILPDGEAHKDWQTLNRIFDGLLEHACDRRSLLVALGGGVVGDIVGFAAATYQRGVKFVQIPTTLLAQVDSSVGGKTAINHPLGKNMVGAFHQPRHVLIDTDVLHTLPDREYRAGLAEVIKYGVGLDTDFFAWLEANIDALNAREQQSLAYAIRRSCEIKAAVVADDEFETNRGGGRALLNFGHTFGHAIESSLGYGVWLHGEAVGCGMALAAGFSASRGLLPEADARRIAALLGRAGLPTTPPEIAAETMLDHMSRDKKNEHGAIRLVLLDRIGHSLLDGTSPPEVIAAFLTGHATQNRARR